ncbi:hypothetical protein DL765_002326 [Monosporascus sp. GIB2]|nr:hypothetical protein DL765_002326 [Monosporascus sp. GIB2]
MDRKLVFAHYFFWKPGSKLQNSLAGLLRSLLHDALESCRELIIDVLPEAWDQVKSTTWQLQTSLRISENDIREAFSRLIKHTNLYKKHSFCFFIDGLDEYEGTRQYDHRDMVDLLCSWTQAAPNEVKICVSSREHNVFTNAFHSENRPRLHDLTDQG